MKLFLALSRYISLTVNESLILYNQDYVYIFKYVTSIFVREMTVRLLRAELEWSSASRVGK